MKVFVDTNIFLDLIMRRDGAKEALYILNSCHQSHFEGFVADITLLNIDYVASKQSKEIKEFLKTISNSFVIVGTDNAMFEKAFAISHNDLEDTIQYLSAKASHCDTIITNDKNFYNTGDIETITSKEFIERV